MLPVAVLIATQVEVAVLLAIHVYALLPVDLLIPVSGLDPLAAPIDLLVIPILVLEKLIENYSKNWQQGFSVNTTS